MAQSTRSVIYFILLVPLIVLATNDEHTCDLVPFFGILDCVNHNLNRIPVIMIGRSDVRVFDLRQNNISKLNVTALEMYPNLKKIVDLRDNSLRCTSINIKDLVIRSDCPMPTVLQSTTSYQDNPQPPL